MWFVYILFCDNQYYYVGLTANIKKRLNEHKSGYNLHTKRYKKIKLLYQETHRTRKSASKREKQLKKWSRAKKKALIEGDLRLLQQLSKS